MGELIESNAELRNTENVVLALARLVEHQDAIRSGRLVPISDDVYEAGLANIFDPLSPEELAAVQERFNEILMYEQDGGVK